MTIRKWHQKNLTSICNTPEKVAQKQQQQQQQQQKRENDNRETWPACAQKQKQQNQENDNKATWPASAALCNAFHPVHFSPSPLMSAPCKKHIISRIKPSYTYIINWCWWALSDSLQVLTKKYLCETLFKSSKVPWGCRGGEVLHEVAIHFVLIFLVNCGHCAYLKGQEN